MQHIVVFTFFVIAFWGNIFAQEEVWMTPNKGQWNERIQYKVDLQSGNLFLERDGFSFLLSDAQEKLGHHRDTSVHEDIHAQFITSKFLNSNWSGDVQHLDSSGFYSNYINGNDPEKWVSGLYSYSRLKLEEIYSGIDLEWDGRNGGLMYTLTIDPGVDPSIVAMKIEGQDDLKIAENGDLIIVTQFGEVRQTKPKAWSLKEGNKKSIPVTFEITDGLLQFKFPKGYNNALPLVIDPNLVFSTFTGSTMDNWGMTATPDNSGNTYAAGVVFGSTTATGGGYPTVPGSFDITYNGGTNYTYTINGITSSYNAFDAVISKFDQTGSSLIYSTYLGGSGNEAPHSLFVDENDELYVMGVTSSANFPVTTGAYDQTFNGGPTVDGNELGYPNGADLYVAHFNAAGTGLVGCTFIGGTDTDGINLGVLNFNYGDPLRGEIIVDNGSVYVASTTRSSDFPMVSASQSSLSGVQDAVVFKMNSALTTLNWSTYFGGSDVESGNSLQISSTGDLFITGGTVSSNLPISNGQDLTYNGGQSDGYIVKMNSANSNVLAGTYVGQNEYDQSYFVQLDVDDAVYIYGQTESSYAISAGVYSNPNSGQFIRKYTNDLSTIDWTTMIGAGSGHPEISPTAFLVSECYDIYIAGWGGSINTSYSQYAQFSSTSGFPVTANAYQAVTNGSNFYLGLLGKDALTFKYGTFIGGTSTSYNHVDGGTSRFDKNGNVYHAVCAACGGNPTGFTSTPGAWSQTNQSFNCNMACFKFELSAIEPIISTPTSVICLPDPVVFNNNTLNGNEFFWDFGDGTYSTDLDPTHLYPGPGTYTVTLIASDSNNCLTPDTVQLEVYIGDFDGGIIQPPAPICPNVPYQMQAYGGANYDWYPPQFFDDPTIADPFITIDSDLQVMCIISDSCGLDTAYAFVEVFETNPVILDETLCLGNSINLTLTGGVSYEWSPGTYLDDSTSSSPLCTATSSISYQVAITTTDGCEFEDVVNVTVYTDPPIPVLADSIEICLGSSAEIEISGGDTYQWYPTTAISPDTGSVVSVNPLINTWYYCDVTNACGTVQDSILVNVLTATITAGNDTIICPGESVNLWASGGISYLWWPGNSLNSVITSQVTATPSQPTVYYVEGTDLNGCTNIDSVFVDLYPYSWVQASPDVYAFLDDEVQLWANASGPGTFIWSPAEFLSCVACADPVATPNQNYGYMVMFVDTNGCQVYDSVYIYYDPIIYVPNTFTPDGNSMNPVFLAKGGNFKNFEMLLFDRWGELIFTSNDINIGWDGTYQGQICQDGTYTWKITVIDFTDNEHKFVGHINLLK